MHDTIIIGGGLFGSVIEAKLAAIGQRTLIIDAGKLNAGSRPAACLMKPSWFSGMGADVYKPALELLDELFTVQEITFEARATKGGKLSVDTTVLWVPPTSILQNNQDNRRVGNVQRFWRNQDGWVVLYTDPFSGMQREVFGHNVVVAAGIWTQELTHNPAHAQVGQMGASLTWAGQLDKPFIHPFAPYRQFVAFNIAEDHIWAGDGTAIKVDNWSDDRIDQTIERTRNYFPHIDYDARDFRIKTGIRPYAKGWKTCLLDNPEPNLWVASGGAKNGTLAAGHCAVVISEAML